jgi:glutamyl/glutaminyl-tRNA synthetase
MTAPRWPCRRRSGRKLRAERGPGVWRFKLIQERIEWTDGILGDLSIDAGSVSDPVLIRADGQVLYTLASVVDDMDMGITHVVRGSDHVTNTATQIQIIEALGGTPPTFAHHSLLTGPQGEALSKRLRTLSLRDLREAGVEPMALLSLMARLGSSQPVELAGSLDEIAEGFDLTQFGAAPTKFDEADLWPLTAHVLQGMDASEMAEELAALGVPDDLAEPMSGRSRAPTSPAAPRWPNGGSCSATGRRPGRRRGPGRSWPRPSPCCRSRPMGRTPGPTGPNAVKEATGARARGCSCRCGRR